MNPTNSRRSFVKQTGAVLLSFQILDLIPHAMAQASGCGASNPDSHCNTDIPGGGKNPDQHCVQGQTGGYDDDAACKGAAANGTGYDQDGMCGSSTGQKIGGQPITDQDAACNTTATSNGTTMTDQDGSCGSVTGPTGAYDTDEACNDGNWNTSDVDQNCRVLGSYDKDESCVSALLPGSTPDEACGYFKAGQRDADQHCNGTVDPDNTYLS